MNVFTVFDWLKHLSGKASQALKMSFGCCCKSMTEAYLLSFPGEEGGWKVSS